MTRATTEWRPWDHFPERQRWLFLTVLFLIAVASYADRQLLPVVLEHIRIEYGLSDRMLGALGGAPFALCYAASCIPFARAADHGNRKLWLIIAFMLWTVMTVLCGFATSLVFLFVARMGVGVGEGGAVPVSHALVADYFPPSARAKAFAVLSSAVTFGGTLALVAGGWLAHGYGWRMAFIVMGVASLPIALLATLILREPPRPPLATTSGPRPAFRRETAALMSKPSFRFLITGFTIYSLFAYGPIIFIPAYLMRVMHLDVAVVGTTYGISSAIGTIIGSIVGGIVCDRLTRRDPRWLVWWPAGSYVIAMPVTWLAFGSQSLAGFLFWAGVLMALLFAALPAVFAAVQHICGPTRRATASAIVMASINAIGLTLGPLATGLISDLLAPSFGIESLRYALMIMAIVLAPAALLFAMASRNFLADTE